MGTHPIFESDFDCLTVEMRSVLILYYLTFVCSVDRNNFKKCSDSSFCERRRVFNGNENKEYKISSHQLIEGGKALELTLEAEERPCLKAIHTLLSGGAARIVIEECQPYKARFQAADVLLVDGYDSVPLTLESSAEFITVTSADGRHLKSGVNGYATEFGKGKTVISVANARNMLYIEELKEKQEGDNWEEKFKTHKDSRPRGPE